MTQQLVPVAPSAAPAPAVPEPPLHNLNDLMRAGAILAKSGFFPDAKAESQAVAKVLAGAELGIGPVASLRNINLIDGKLALSAALISALIKRSRPLYDYRAVETTPKHCEIAFFERGQEVGRAVFTLEEAASAGLANKQNWQKYPSDMLFARALTRGARRYCPDLFIGGVYTPEELSDPLPVEPAPQRPRARASDLYADEPMSQAHAVAAAHGTAVPGETDIPWSQVWAEAKALDFPTKRAVHEALGIEPRDGALAEAVESGRFASRSEVLRRLRIAADERNEHDTLDAMLAETPPDDDRCPACGVAWDGEGCLACGYHRSEGLPPTQQPELVSVPAAYVDPADARRHR